MYPTYEGVLIVLAVGAAVPLYHAVALLIEGVRWFRNRRATPSPVAERTTATLSALRQPRNASYLSNV
jgi:hypothetical protein